MATKSATTKAPSDSELREKAWEMYLRLCDAPGMQGKEQSYIRDVAIERTRAFLKATEDGV